MAKTVAILGFITNVQVQESTTHGGVGAAERRITMDMLATDEVLAVTSKIIGISKAALLATIGSKMACMIGS